MSVRKAFYVGSDKVFISSYKSETWAKSTLGEAIAHAERLLTADASKQECFIVEVIKVVKRRPSPIIVEDVE